MNSCSVITKDENKLKTAAYSPHLYPKISILDPTSTFSLPISYTSWGAVDAISHILEVYFTLSDSWAPIQERFMEGLIKTIMESTERIINNIENNVNDYLSRSTLM